jgi:hypothetical protein
MTRIVLPDNVRRFLANDVISVERLDVLLFLYRNATRWWAAPKLGTELEMPPDAVQSHLEHLSTRNLLDVRIAESVIFCFKPLNEELAQLVEAVARAHYQDRDAVGGALTDRHPAEGARLFAEAFRLRKGRRDG